jgi:shikimate dehydrogenase
MKAAVIGYPIAHSKSPYIHEYWMKQNNIAGSYEAISIDPKNFKDGIQKLIGQNYNGFNVTVPHKQNIIEFCSEIDKTAQAIGAVNTILIKDQKLIGKNTDSFGFIENIKQQKPNFIFKNKQVLILGAGGASRAIIYGLKQQNVAKIHLSNRTLEKAQILAKEFDIEFIEWEKKESVLDKIDLLINTTSLGMVGKPELELSLETLKPEALVTDIVYAPLMTELLKQAKNKHNQIVTGIGMLLHQARPAFQAWTGIMPDVTEELEELILA